MTFWTEESNSLLNISLSLFGHPPPPLALFENCSSSSKLQGQNYSKKGYSHTTNTIPKHLLLKRDSNQGNERDKIDLNFLSILLDR